MVGCSHRHQARLIDEWWYSLVVGLTLSMGGRLQLWCWETGLWGGMSGVMTKTNHNKHCGSCFVICPLPLTVLWGCLCHIVAPTSASYSPHHGWFVTSFDMAKWRGGILKVWQHSLGCFLVGAVFAPLSCTFFNCFCCCSTSGSLHITGYLHWGRESQENQDWEAFIDLAAVANINSDFSNRFFLSWWKHGLAPWYCTVEYWLSLLLLNVC